MAKIEQANYNSIAAKAKDIRAHAESFNKFLSNAYDQVIILHKNWYGKRYNELAKDFNDLAPVINEMLQIIVAEIPFALEVVANNYSYADAGYYVTSAQQTQPVKMPNIPTPNDEGLRFMSDQVTVSKEGIKSKIKNAMSELNEAENTYKKAQEIWQSEAATAFTQKFTKLKNQITNEIDTIYVEFDKLMQQTLDDIQTTENKSTV